VSETRVGNCARRRVLVVEFLCIPDVTSYRLGYARVSTLEQDPAAQLDALAAAGVDQVYVDHASGVLTERPELANLLRQLRSGDTLVVWRLDRLGRSTAHLIQTVTELGGAGHRVSFAARGDQHHHAGRAIAVRHSRSLAAFERDLIRERTAAGLAAARERGKVGGRPSSMTPDKLAVARQMLAEGRPRA
jgi:DNA invertase Pin-like site-specific DNA recombinase